MLSSAILSLGILLSPTFALQLVPLSSEHFVEKPRLTKRYLNTTSADPSDLDLRDYDSFYWGGHGGDSLVFANLTLFFRDEYTYILSMDRFTGMLNAVDCHAESMMIQFNSNDSFTSARNSWNWVSDAVNNTFVLIANYDGCGPDQERQPFLVNDLSFVGSNFTVFLEAQQKEWEEVAETYSFNMGYRPPLNSSVLARRDDPDFVMSLASNFNRNLFTTEVDGIELSVDCVNCGTSGKLNVDFDLDVNVFSDSHLAMKVSPQDVAAFLQLGLSASGTLAKEYRWEKNLISIPIEGVKVGSFAKIGAFLDVDVGFTMDEWTGEADAQFGARMGLSNNAIVEIDALHLGSGKFSGWDPALTAIPFTVSAKVEGGVTIYAQPAISLSAEAFGKGIELSLDLRMPYIDGDFTAMADSGGVCDTQQTIGVDVSASAGVDLSVQVATAGNEANPLWEQELLDKSWPLFDKCFAFGPKNAQSGATIMPKPPKKTKAKASKTKAPIKEIPTSAPAKTLKPNTTKDKSEGSSIHTPTKTKTDDETPTPKPKPSSSGSKSSDEPSNSSAAPRTSSTTTSKGTASNSVSNPINKPTSSSGASESFTNTESGIVSKSASKMTKNPSSSSAAASSTAGSSGSKSSSKYSTGTESGSSQISGTASGSRLTSSTSEPKSNTNKDTSSSTKTGINTKSGSSSPSGGSLTRSSTESKSGTTSITPTDSKTNSISSTESTPTETEIISKSGYTNSFPTDSKTGSLTITSYSSISSAAACQLPKRAINPEDFYCDENGHTHTTITTSTISALTTPNVTCSAAWTQACYHYRSVMSVNSDNPDMVRFTCGATSSSAPGKATKVWSTTTSRNNVVITPKGSQHHWQWIEGWVAAGEGECDRDEWPPRAFWPVKKTNQLGQMVRFLPSSENRKAGRNMFRTFCERNGARGEDGKKNTKFHTTSSRSESVGVTSGVTTTATYVQVEVPQPVFEITDWDGLPKDAGDPDGLKKNPCWPSMIVPDDPGFALLTDDPYYLTNIRAAATVTDYAKAPEPSVTSGKVPLWSVSIPASQSSADESMDDLDATTTAIMSARGLDSVRRLENSTDEGDLVDIEKGRAMVKRGMWVEVMIASPAEAEAIPTPIVEVKDPVMTLKTIARTKIRADLAETTGI